MRLVRWWYVLPLRLRSLLRRDAVEGEIDEELRYHLERQIEENIERGLTPDDARLAAERQFGNLLLQRERTRDVDIPLRLDLLQQDVRYAARQLRRSPAFTLLAVSALAIGVGANVALFSFINGWLVRPIDANQPAQLVRVTGPGGDAFSAAATNNEAHILPADFIHYRSQNQTFSALAAGHIGGPTRVRWDGPAQMIVVTPVTGNYFEMLGVAAAVGRTLTPEDASRNRQVVVLTDAGWRRFFRSDPRVVGASVFLDGIPHVVVGVLPDWFTGTNAPMVPQIFRPIHEQGGQLAFGFRLLLIGRLKPDVSLDQARADLQRIASQLTSLDAHQRFIEIYPARAIMPPLFRGVLALTLMFVLIVGVVLLVTCDNIAILTSLRSAARSREIAVRLALGASRSRVVGQLVLESAILCAGAGAVATYVAFSTARLATQFYLPVPVPFALTFKPDWRVITFAVLTSALTVVLCGLLPALKTLKTDLVTTLKGTGVAQGVQAGLVVTQMALSTMLLVCAVVLAHSITIAGGQSRAFTSDNVVMSTLALGGDQYSAERRREVIQALLERIETSPDVSAAAVVANIPGGNNAPVKPAVLRSEGRTQQVQVNLTSRGLFRTLAIPLLAGRDFSVQDDTVPATVGIVNESLARLFWPGQNPIGRQLQDDQGAVIHVIGLVRDSEYASADDPRRPFIYRPLSLDTTTSPTFLLKAAGDPSAVLPLVRTRAVELDPDLAAYNVMTMDERLDLGLVVNRAASTASGSLGVLALALGAIGIYGTMSFLVQQRRREVGVRMALGASRADVVRQISGHGMRWIITGTLIGLVLAGLASLGLSRVLRGITPGDPLAFAVTTVVLIGVAYVACQVPARRASRVSPIEALRVE